MRGRRSKRFGRGRAPQPAGEATPDGTVEEGDGAMSIDEGGPVRLCGPEDVAPGEARCFDVAGRPVALARIGDEYFAVDDTCSHADYSLSEGDVDVDECALECPAHGSLFDLRTGAALTLPAVSPVAVHEVAVSAGGVHVTLRGDDPGGSPA